MGDPRDVDRTRIREAFRAIVGEEWAFSGHKIIAALDAAFAASPYVEIDRDKTPGTEPHPDEPHEFRTVCRRCGEDGHLFVAIITDDEVVRIEPREAVADPPAEEVKA